MEEDADDIDLEELLRSPAEYAEAKLAAGDVSLHVDPLLARNPAVYADFLVKLQKRGLLSFRPYRHPTVGVFFVKKKIML